MCKLGNKKSDHDCRKNFTGTAKAMEPDMAVELIVHNTLLKEKNVKIKTLISENDSSTPAAVRRSASYEIEKLSDYNHTVKSFTSALYGMKLSRNLIEYFSHCFSHAIKQNKGNSEAVKQTLLSIISHAFGEHTTCGDWCKTDAEGKYVHKHLPNEKPLEDPQLRLSLIKIISRYVNNVDKIAPCGSTQANESMNNIIAQKCIKSRYYASSESLNFRVAAAVCQKNLGHKYMENVFDKLQLTSTQETIKFRHQKDMKREKRALRSKQVAYKKKG
ncbi:uncharacterized protein LOC105203515 [Solenopsis invicta]|uniref:uncharacterized protein LOC105203515 n=1 Tax=Solenopsis invicta TaxID=13686 RepID=UPI0005960895|nr:uncharacterized protein LOC105203515 [Solenopsis invicta]